MIQLSYKAKSRFCQDRKSRNRAGKIRRARAVPPGWFTSGRDCCKISFPSRFPISFWRQTREAEKNSGRPADPVPFFRPGPCSARRRETAQAEMPRRESRRRKKKSSLRMSPVFSRMKRRCGRLLFAWTGRISRSFRRCWSAPACWWPTTKAFMKISRLYQSRNPWVDKVSPKVTMLGDWGVDCGIAGLFFLGGLIAQGPESQGHGADGLGNAAAHRLPGPGRQAPGRAPAPRGRERHRLLVRSRGFFQALQPGFFFALRLFFFRAHRLGLGPGHGDRRKLQKPLSGCRSPATAWPPWSACRG